MVKELRALTGDAIERDAEQDTAALERALEATRRESEVAHALLGLSAALAEVRTVEETLERAVAIVPELCGADRCFAVSWDAANRRLQIRAQWGFDGVGSAALSDLSAQEDGFRWISQALQTGSPVVISDVASDGGVLEQQARSRHIGAFVSIPLIRWGQEIGVLGLEFAEPRRFESKEIALARGIARELGMALANSRRFNLLLGLRAFGLRAGSKLSLTGVMSEATAAAKELLGGDAAMMYFFDGERRTLVAGGGEGLPPPTTAQALSFLDLEVEPWNRLTEGSTVFVPDLPAATGVEGVPSAALAAVIPRAPSSLMGALVVFFQSPVAIGRDEAEALNVAAAQCASAIDNARRFEQQQNVASSLQSGLMSTEMPIMDTCAVAAVYESAELEVGGDFFDVFELPGQRIAVVVGDVSGKGAEAAAQTAMAKYMLRAFAMEDPEPSSVLFRLNNALVQGLGSDRFITAVYVLIEHSSLHCRLARGGHPPPLVYRKDQSDVEAVVSDGLIMGAFQNQSFEARTLDLASGDVLLLHTDGLADVRRDQETFGRHRVVESLMNHASDLTAGELVRALYEDARAFGQVKDDTVVLAVTCCP